MFYTHYSMATILIVEDDSTLLKVYNEVLSDNGYTVISASSADQAKTILQQSTVNLILLDIMLPGSMNGFELLSEIKRTPATATVPTVIMTNLDNEKATGQALGASDYYVKSSMTIDDLLAKVRELLPQT